jgi:hypothetical protein
VEWVFDALKRAGGELSPLGVAKYIWETHKSDLRASGDFFYKWQYEVRWAGQMLQNSGRAKKTRKGNSSVWSLTGK